MARCLLKARSVPASIWGEAVMTAVYLLNRGTTKSAVAKKPHEAWCGRRPSVQHLRVFGCVAHVKNTRPNLKKLDDRSTPMVLFGYEPGTATYRVYDPSSGKVMVSRDVVFDEDAAWDWSSTKRGKMEAAITFNVEHFVVPHAGAEAGQNTTRPEHALDMPTQSGTRSERALSPPSDAPGMASPSTPATPTTPSPTAGGASLSANERVAAVPW
jgi:hypothetical protein